MTEDSVTTTGETRGVSFMTYVYVLHQKGKPLMPTNPGKARILLKSGLAKVVSREPFTIQLLYETSEFVQELTVGVDPGSGTAGFAVAEPAQGLILYRSEVQLRQDISRNMSQRLNYRRTRRNRKTRYRKARFLNRGNSVRKNRYSPTVESKVNAHERESRLIESILPVKTIVYENSQFDTHAIANFEVLKDNSLYQKAPQYGFENTRTYVLCRDGILVNVVKAKARTNVLRFTTKYLDVKMGLTRQPIWSPCVKHAMTKYMMGFCSQNGKGKQRIYRFRPANWIWS
jgi:hypothetical protein